MEFFKKQKHKGKDNIVKDVAEATLTLAATKVAVDITKEVTK